MRWRFPLPPWGGELAGEMEASSPVSFWLKFGVYLFEIQTPLGTRGCLCAPPWVCISEGGRPSSSPGILQVYSYAQNISGSVIYEREVYPTEMTFKTDPALSSRMEPFPIPAGLFLSSRNESLLPRSRRGPVPARPLGSVTPEGFLGGSVTTRPDPSASVCGLWAGRKLRPAAGVETAPSDPP